MGMAFTDVILSETDADLIIVDQNAKPGGHWNHAYPFVTLHQPRAFTASPPGNSAEGSSIRWA